MKTTLEPHVWTGPTGITFTDIPEPSGTYYRRGTPRAIIDALERARINGLRIRFWTGDQATGKNWYDENDVCGFVGRSSGLIKSPLLLRGLSSIGGQIISTDIIVCLIVDKREVWRAPGFEMPQVTVRNDGETGLPWVAYIEGKVHARFKNGPSAIRWQEFMEGRRVTP